MSYLCIENVLLEELKNKYVNEFKVLTQEDLLDILYSNGGVNFNDAVEIRKINKVK